LIRENLRITTSGFGIPKQNWPRHVHHFLVKVEHEELNGLFSAFRVCCDYLRWKNRLEQGSCLSDLMMAAENWAWQPPFARPQIPLGVMMLAVKSMGYELRQVKGSTDARIERFVG
jgi:hypothetical protein